MKKLDKLIIKVFIGPFVATFFVTLFVLVMQFLWKYIDDLVGKGLDVWTVSKLIFYMSATMVPLALPLAVLLSSIMTFGNLGESFELVALKSAGISLLRFMRPLIIVCAFICTGAFLFSNYVIPVANLHAQSLLYDIVNLKHGFNIREGVFFDEIDNLAIKVGKKDPDGKTIHEVVIYDNRDQNSVKLILAKSGIMEESPNKKFVYLTLKDGWQYEERGYRPALTNEFIRTSFKEFREVIDLSSFALTRTPLALFKNVYLMLNVRQLDQAIDSIRVQLKYSARDAGNSLFSRYAFFRWQDTGWLKAAAPPLKADRFSDIIPDSLRSAVYDRALMNQQEGSSSLVPVVQQYQDTLGDIRKDKVEWHKKFTFSFACMVLFLIGAPLGSIIRKGGLGTPLVFAVIFFVIFHVLSFIGENLAKNGAMSVVNGMWMATAVLVPVAVFLIYKAMNDSRLFNKEFYFRFFRNIQIFFAKTKTAEQPV